MSEYFYVICSLVALVILLITIDLKLTKTGKAIVIGITFLICELGQYLTNYYHLVGSILISFLLLLASSYLLQSKLNHMLYIHTYQLRNSTEETNQTTTSIIEDYQNIDFPQNLSQVNETSEINYNNEKNQSLQRNESFL